MISDFIILNKKSDTPLYVQIYRQLREAILNGSLKENEKIPSVRKLSADLEISKTTAEAAYNRLCSEGYIINMPQKGYFVEKGLKHTGQKPSGLLKASAKKYYPYDFSGKGIDNNCSNIREWRKYVKDILNKEYLLNTYSENQGEEELRENIAKYAFSTRGAHSAAENIIIGSGSQTLIYILCGMLGLNKKVAIEKNTFPQAEQVFRDFDYQIRYTESDSKGISMGSLKEVKPDILLINPNHNSKNGIGIHITRKAELVSFAKENGCLIIEDDYNGELRYSTHPAVCLQSFDTEQTVYIGSFSKVLLPSVRISYMILPDNLISVYNSIKENYNQTTSKVEQLALASYLRDGKLEKHLRKSRRYYKNKAEQVKSSIEKYFDSFVFNETSMYFEITSDKKDAVEKCRENGIKLMATSTDERLRVNFSQINSDIVEEGIALLHNIIK